MNGIIGMIELALDTKLTAEQRDFISTARESADSLLILLNDILDFAKIESGHLTLENIDFDLRSVVEGVATTMAARADKKGLEVICLIPPDLPTRLRGDPGRLRQVLINLTGNAVKFTSHGEIVLRANMDNQSAKNVIIKFAVTDTGIGIPPERQAAVFDRFVQVDSSTTRKFGGTGLGLAISKQLAELMGGRIGLISEPNVGSTFWFTAEFEFSEEAPQDSSITHVPLVDLRVLVVDDNPTNRLVMQKILSSFGCRPVTLGNAYEVVDTLYAGIQNKDPFGMVILDMQMPEKDGENILQEIKSGKGLKDIPVIMLTSLGSRGDANRLLSLGCSGYLVKPIRKDQLLDTLLAVLSNSGLGGKSGHTGALVTRHTISEMRRNAAHLLLAEDNPINQKLAVHLLQKAGYSVDVVDDGRAAVDAMVKKSYSLVLMDVQMPELDGFEATNEYRRKEQPGAHVPIIAMTAHAMKGDREKCLSSGMDDYLSKPLDPAEFYEVIEKWLSHRLPIQETSKTQGDIQKPSNDVSILNVDEALPRFGDDRKFFQNMLIDFVDTLPERVDSLRQAIEKKDATQVNRIAHNLKGASANFSAEPVRKLAMDLEWMGSQGNLDGAPASWEQLQAESLRLQQFAKQNSITEIS
jgi:CheY-like chemotaxis protein